MERSCRWYSHLEDVRDHQLDSVLWHRPGYERGPLILPAGATPQGPFTRMSTIEELLTPLQQALASDASLRQSLQRHDAMIITAQMNEHGTSYRFHPVHDSSVSSS
jgi:hypothetical protein